jgi:hypothetical protein
MKKAFMLVAALAVMACDRADDRDGTDTTVVGGDVDVGLTTDTVNVPTFSTEKDTLVIEKPVVSGRKPVEVKRPDVDVKRP